MLIIIKNKIKYYKPETNFKKCGVWGRSAYLWVSVRGSVGEVWKIVLGCGGSERGGVGKCRGDVKKSMCVGGVGEVSGGVVGGVEKCVGYMKVCDDLLRGRDKTST